MRFIKLKHFCLLLFAWLAGLPVEALSSLHCFQEYEHKVITTMHCLLCSFWWLLGLFCLCFFCNFFLLLLLLSVFLSLSLTSPRPFFCSSVRIWTTNTLTFQYVIEQSKTTYLSKTLFFFSTSPRQTWLFFWFLFQFIHLFLSALWCAFFFSFCLFVCCFLFFSTSLDSHSHSLILFISLWLCLMFFFFCLFSTNSHRSTSVNSIVSFFIGATILFCSPSIESIERMWTASGTYLVCSK